MTAPTQPTTGAMRAAIKCIRLSGRIQGDIPDDVLAIWGAVTDMAREIDRESGAAELLTALHKYFAAIDALEVFEQQNPRDSTKKWDERFNALQISETELRAIAKAATPSPSPHDK